MEAVVLGTDLYSSSQEEEEEERSFIKDLQPDKTVPEIPREGTARFSLVTEFATFIGGCDVDLSYR